MIKERHPQDGLIPSTHACAWTATCFATCVATSNGSGTAGFGNGAGSCALGDAWHACILNGQNARLHHMAYRCRRCCHCRTAASEVHGWQSADDTSRDAGAQGLRTFDCACSSVCVAGGVSAAVTAAGTSAAASSCCMHMAHVLL